MSPGLRRFGAQIMAYLVGGIVVACLGLIGAMLFGGRAHAQVADRPITTWPTTWTGTVFDVSGTGGCIAGWERPDRFSEWKVRRSFLEAPRLQREQLPQILRAVSAQGLGTLASLRDAHVLNDVGETDAALQPCMDKLQAPPPGWIVAPNGTAPDRPAYCVKADGTRDATKACGRAPVTFFGGSMWCRGPAVVEATGNVYRGWVGSRETFDPDEVRRVTLCREVK